MTAGPEFTDVERPFLDQLADLGWRVITGSLDFPTVTSRGNFREVLQRINRRPSASGEDGGSWLDSARVSQAVSALERIGSKRLMEANQEATELLLSGIAVEGLPDWDQGRSRTVHYVDWDHPRRENADVDPHLDQIVERLAMMS